MLNNLKLFEGEKKFRELKDKNPLDAYFHEALVQVQYQIYCQIKLAQGEKEDEVDSLGNDNFGFGDSTKSENTNLNYKEVFVENGLDRDNGEEKKISKRKAKKINKKKEKKEKNKKEEDEKEDEKSVVKNEDGEK